MTEGKVCRLAAFLLTAASGLFPAGQYRRVPSLRSRRIGRSDRHFHYPGIAGLGALQFTVR
jgi:hypothetical protein